MQDIAYEVKDIMERLDWCEHTTIDDVKAGIRFSLLNLYGI